MNHRTAGVLAALATGFLAMAVWGAPLEDQSTEDKPREQKSSQDEKVDGWMKGKLRSTQGVFDALTNGDLDTVATSARRMHGMNVLEQWARSNDYVNRSEYKGQLNAFEFAVKELVRHAEDDDIDGSLEAYVDMSRSCVRCHKLVRDRSDRNAAAIE